MSPDCEASESAHTYNEHWPVFDKCEGKVVFSAGHAGKFMYIYSLVDANIVDTLLVNKE